jgi:hypothetical protein
MNSILRKRRNNKREKLENKGREVEIENDNN